MQCKSYSHFFSKKFQYICVSLDINFNESLTNDVVSFEQLGPERHIKNVYMMIRNTRLLFEVGIVGVILTQVDYGY